MFSGILIKDVKLHFGQLVKLLRKRDKLSQDELAKKLGMSRITIQNLESGRYGSVDTMLILLQHFNLLEDFNKLIKEQIDTNSIDSLY